MDAINFQSRCTAADIVLTGEGRLDETSLHGKVCMSVAKVAHRLGKPCLAIVGSAGPGAETCVDRDCEGALTRYITLCDRFGEEESLNNPAMCIAKVTTDIVRDFWEKRRSRKRR